MVLGCDQEIDQLCDEWTPEPLHPPITKEMELSPPVLERYIYLSPT
jgi:serine palmitoyltransferase